MRCPPLAFAAIFLALAAPARATSIQAVGFDDHNELGIGYSQTRVSMPQGVVGLTSATLDGGGSLGSALLPDGTLFVWGGNQFGQLGNGTKGKGLEAQTPIPILTGVRQASMGGVGGIAVKTDGSVWTWGTNQYGQIGDGQTGGGTEQGGIKFAAVRPFQVPGITTAVQVLSAGASNFALLADGTVLGWGEARFGQLGLGLKAPEQLHPVLVEGLTGIVQIAGGGIATYENHILGRRANGTVLALGGQSDGQLGIGSKEAQATPVPIQLSGVTDIASSARTSAAIVGGHIYVWGDGKRGALGYRPPDSCGGKNNPTPCSLVPRVVPGVTGASDVSLGEQTTYAIANGTLLAWGANGFGQLGNGTTTDTKKPTVIMRGAHQVSAEHAGVLVEADAPAPPPRLTATPGLGSITVSWESPSSTERFQLTPAQGSLKLHTVMTTEHSYTFTGLSGLWRIGINGPEWGRAQIVVAAGALPGAIPGAVAPQEGGTLPAVGSGPGEEARCEQGNRANCSRHGTGRPTSRGPQA